MEQRKTTPPLPFKTESVRLVTLRDNSVLAVGGRYRFNASDTVYVHRDGEKDWRLLPALPEGLVLPAVLELQNGSILVSGGLTGIGDDPDVFSKEMYLLGSKRKEWKHIATLPISLYDHAMVELQDGLIYFAGGCGDGVVNGYYHNQQVFRYRISTGRWKRLPDLPTRPHDLRLTAFADGTVLATTKNGIYGKQDSHHILKQNGLKWHSAFE